MADTNEGNGAYTAFLGTGWGFPPSFSGGGVRMSEDEQDIHESLRILFGTIEGERFLVPAYGLDMHPLMFEPVSTTLRTLVADRARIQILVYEPRIKVISLQVDSPDPEAGVLALTLEYEVRSTNSRFNLVYPFYRTDSNEVRSTVAGTEKRPGDV
jgi:phage baseplate assembly protein W